MEPLRRPRFKQLDGLCHGNSTRQGKQQVDVVSGAANGQGRNSILTSDADIAMKPFLHVFPDRRPAFCGCKHDMNQTTYVTMRHGFQPTLKARIQIRVYPGPVSWVILSRPFGTCHAARSNPRTAPDFLHAALDRSAYAAFFTESRTRLFDSTKLHRKSGYVLGYFQPSLTGLFPHGSCQSAAMGR